MEASKEDGVDGGPSQREGEEDNTKMVYHILVINFSGMSLT